jgi:uncharacterized protein YegP (UPF0339 family)
MAAKQEYAIIQKVTKGRNAGQWKFTLHGRNGEMVAQSHPETYKQKEMCEQTLINLFPNFEIKYK